MPDVVHSRPGRLETSPQCPRGLEFNLFSEALNGPQYWDAIEELRRHGRVVWVNDPAR